SKSLATSLSQQSTSYNHTRIYTVLQLPPPTSQSIPGTHSEHRLPPGCTHWRCKIRIHANAAPPRASFTNLQGAFAFTSELQPSMQNPRLYVAIKDKKSSCTASAI